MKLMLTLHRRKLLEASLGAFLCSRRKVTQPLVAAACSLQPGGKWRRSERIQRKERRARSRTRAPAPRSSDSVNLGLAGNGPILILQRFFHFYIKKTKFQKYMSNKEILKNGCLMGDRVTVAHPVGDRT